MFQLGAVSYSSGSVANIPWPVLEQVPPPLDSSIFTGGETYGGTDEGERVELLDDEPVFQRVQQTVDPPKPLPTKPDPGWYGFGLLGNIIKPGSLRGSHDEL